MKFTLPVGPVPGVTLAVKVTPVPLMEGFGAEVKLVLVAARITICVLIWAVFCRLPEPPVIVILNVPVVAVAFAVSVSVLVVVVLVGLNDAATPVDSPDADKLTAPVKPFCAFTLTVIGPLLVPCVMVTVVGDVESQKFGPDVQLFTKLVTFTLPMPVAKSQPGAVL